MLSALATWILGLLVVLQPNAPWKATYEQTAKAIAQVVEEEPPLFEGDMGKYKSAALMSSLAWFESTLNPSATGDHGVSHGLFQVQGHGDLRDPLDAARASYAMVRQSFRICKARPIEERLAWYAAGGYDCTVQSEDAVKKSRNRVLRGMWLFRKYKPAE
jgi:hypothetical protein